MDARVIPLLRLPARLTAFDYHIPDTMQVQTGDLVLVPFRTKNVRAVIWEVGDAFSEAKSSIVRPLVAGAVSPMQQKVLGFTAEYYGGSIATLLKTNLPLFPLRETKQISIPKERSTGRAVPPASNVVYASYTEKYAHMAEQIKAARGNSICIFPTVTALRAFYDANPRLQKLCDVVQPDQSSAESRRIYMHIRMGKARVILTTKAGIFSPWHSVHTIIIDDDEHPAHKQYDQQPFPDTRTIAEFLAKMTRAKLIRYMQAPRASLWYALAHAKGSFQRIGTRYTYRPPEIVDLHQERFEGNYALLGEKLIEALAVKKSGPALLYVNRVAIKDQQESTRIAPSIESLANEVKERFPHLRIALIHAGTMIPTKEQLQKFDVLIGTERFRTVLPLDIHYSIVAAIAIDMNLQRPNYLAHETTFQALIALQNHALRCRVPFVIQTWEPQDILFRSLRPTNWHHAYRYILEERRSFSYPPFTALTRIILPDASNETKKILQDLRGRLPQGAELSPLFMQEGKRSPVAILRERPAAAHFGSMLQAHIPNSWKIDVDPLDLE